jgi:predicted O-methyltransferase YrrM
MKTALRKYIVPMTTSYHALSPEQQRLWKLQRWFVRGRRRWLFEGSLQLPGQLWFAERDALCWAIRAYRPRAVFEVGTWRGGGSTLFIAQSLYETGGGTLHTIDIDAEMVADTKRQYAKYLAHLLPIIRFHVGLSTDVYPPLLRQIGTIDAVFLDGEDSPQRTLAELLMFLPFLRPGGLLIAHDWLTAKMELVRPLVELSREWAVVKKLSGPASVGFVVAEYQPATA